MSGVPDTIWIYQSANQTRAYGDSFDEKLLFNNQKASAKTGRDPIYGFFFEGFTS